MAQDELLLQRRLVAMGCVVDDLRDAASVVRDDAIRAALYEAAEGVRAAMMSLVRAMGNAVS